MRRLASFLVAMFVASNVAAAARACVDGLSGPAGTEIHLSAAGPDWHACPDTIDAAGDHAHCKQTHKNDNQKSLKDAPPAATLPAAPSFTRVTPERSRTVAALPSPSRSGPSLTLLYGNLRL